MGKEIMAGFINQTEPVIVTDSESKFYGQIGNVEEYGDRGYFVIFDYDNGDQDGAGFNIRQIENVR